MESRIHPFCKLSVVGFQDRGLIPKDVECESNPGGEAGRLINRSLNIFDCPPHLGEAEPDVQIQPV